jgi:hypothetical protein
MLYTPMLIFEQISSIKYLLDFRWPSAIRAMSVWFSGRDVGRQRTSIRNTCQLTTEEICGLLTIPPHSPRPCSLPLPRPSLDNGQSVVSEVHIWWSFCIRHGLLGATDEKRHEWGKGTSCVSRTDVFRLLCFLFRLFNFNFF